MHSNIHLKNQIFQISSESARKSNADITGWGKFFDFNSILGLSKNGPIFFKRYSIIRNDVDTKLKPLSFWLFTSGKKWRVYIAILLPDSTKIKQKRTFLCRLVGLRICLNAGTVQPELEDSLIHWRDSYLHTLTTVNLGPTGAVICNKKPQWSHPPVKIIQSHIKKIHNKDPAQDKILITWKKSIYILMLCVRPCKQNVVCMNINQNILRFEFCMITRLITLHTWCICFGLCHYIFQH